MTTELVLGVFRYAPLGLQIARHCRTPNSEQPRSPNPPLAPCLKEKVYLTVAENDDHSTFLLMIIKDFLVWEIMLKP